MLFDFQKIEKQLPSTSIPIFFFVIDELRYSLIKMMFQMQIGFGSTTNDITQRLFWYQGKNVEENKKKKKWEKKPSNSFNLYLFFLYIYRLNNFKFYNFINNFNYVDFLS